MLPAFFLISPAHVHSQLLGRDAGGRGVESFDVRSGQVQEFLLSQILKSGVSGHRQIGAIKLQLQATGCDRLILWPHGGDQIRQIR